MKTNSSSIALRAPQPRSGASSWYEALVNVVRQAVARIKRQRRVRRDVSRLLELDDRLLADIGISRAELLHSIGYRSPAEGRRAAR